MTLLLANHSKAPVPAPFDETLCQCERCGAMLRESDMIADPVAGHPAIASHIRLYCFICWDVIDAEEADIYLKQPLPRE